MSELFNAPFWILVGLQAGIFSVFSAGLQLQLGVSGLANFGHAASMAIGAYGTAILVIKAGWPLGLSAATAIAFAVVFGLIVCLPSLRLTGDYFAMTTLAFALMIFYLARNATGLTGGVEGTLNLAGTGQVGLYNGGWLPVQADVQSWLASFLGGWVSEPDGREFTMLVIVWAIALTVVTVLWLLERSPWGRVQKAVRDDPDAAAAVGKSVFLYRLSSLSIGSALGALGGILFALEYPSFAPDSFDPMVTFLAFLVVILGGVTTAWGVALGALCYGFIFSVTNFLSVWPLSLLDAGGRAALRVAIVGLLLILMVALRPQGLLGRKEELGFD